jgi:hypothetical protein
MEQLKLKLMDLILGNSKIGDELNRQLSSAWRSRRKKAKISYMLPPKCPEKGQPAWINVSGSAALPFIQKIGLIFTLRHG